jgi:hypothetical protein
VSIFVKSAVRGRLFAKKAAEPVDLQGAGCIISLAKKDKHYDNDGSPKYVA